MGAFILSNKPASADVLVAIGHKWILNYQYGRYA